jgi:D-lactate dehydrogenase
MKIIIYDTHRFERPFLERAFQESKYEHEFVEARLCPLTADLAKGYDSACIFIHDDASKEVLERLYSLGIRHLALRSAGYNNVDLQVANKLGIKVANVPTYSPYAVAEHTVGLMLALNRKLVRAHNRVMELNFSLDGLVGFDMNQRTIGIVGLGRIGTVVAKILNGFGCKLLGYDLNPDKDLTNKYDLTFVSLEELCAQADIVTLHVPLNKHTHYMINSRTIALMKPGVMLINSSRGGLVNTKDVIEGLKRKQIGYLGLDVYEEEEGLFFQDLSEQDMLQDDVISRLMTFRNVLITSHQAFLTKTALKNIADTTIENLRIWADGKNSPNEVGARS